MTTCAIRFKHWVLRHYLWISCALLAVVFLLAVALPLESWQARLAIFAFPFAFLVAVQRQKTEELMLFKELFEKFNARYDGLNKGLNAIYEGPETKPLSEDERNLLFTYFNLCGEEYLFCSQGYIYPEVWTAWQNGMKVFYKNCRIRKLWDDELGNDSYYGFHWGRHRDQKGNTTCF